MPKVAKQIHCSESERIELHKIVNSQKAEHRIVRRAKMVLLCLDGMQIKDIASKLGERPNTVSLWRDRFAEQGIPGRQDKKRRGRTAQYGPEFREMVLNKLKETPPSGLARWDGPTLARVLNVSKAAVWRLMRKEGIQLARQRSWCVSTDPEFTKKSADIVGLYLDPPENAVVISVDEKPSIQALSRAQGYVLTHNKKIVRGLKSTYRRNGTINLFGALEVATGQIYGKLTKRKTREDFEEFLDDLLESEPGGNEVQYHIIVDNYCTHKRLNDWLEKHPNVHFHYTPTSASWLNEVEIWFNIMSRKVLRGASFDSVSDLVTAIKKFIAAYDEHAEPFRWKKREVKGSQLRNTIGNLRN